MRLGGARQRALLADGDEVTHLGGANNVTSRDEWRRIRLFHFDLSVMRLGRAGQRALLADRDEMTLLGGANNVTGRDERCAIGLFHMTTLRWVMVRS